MLHFIKNLDLFLDKKLKIQLIFYSICLFIVPLLETIGISIIPIFISLYLKEGFFYDNSPIYIINIINNLDTNKFLTLSFLIIIITFFLKNLIIILIHRFHLLISKSLTSKTTISVVRDFFDKGYLNFKDITIGEKLRDITIETKNSSKSIMNYLSICQDSIFIIFILTLLFIASSSASVFIISILIIISILLFISYSALIKKLGIALISSRKILFNKILEISNLMREIKVFKKEDFFIGEFNKELNKLLSRDFKKLFLLSIPRHVTEISAVFLILLIIVNDIFFNNLNFQTVIPQLTLVIIASLKAIPLINALLVKVSLAKSLKISNKVILKYLKREINIRKKIKIKKNTKIETLKLENFNFRYKKKVIFKNQNFSLKRGDFVGIYGPSGEGKSTLLDILIGAIKIDKGSIYLNKKKIDDIDKVNLQISFASQNPKLINASLKENIAFGQELEEIDIKKVKSLVNMVGLNRNVSSKKIGINSNVGDDGNKLSGGQIQRIAIARALYNEPDLIIFDEPTSSLDKSNEKIIFDLIKKIFKNKKDMIIVYVSHSFPLIKKANKKYLVKNQKITLVQQR